MDKVKSFEQLEEVVNKLLIKLDDLKAQNKTLELRLNEKNETIDELQGKVSSLSADHENINARVSTLISSIEEWEKSADADTDSPVVQDTSLNEDNAREEQGEAVVPSESNLFSMGN